VLIPHLQLLTSLQAGPVLKAHSPASVNEMIISIQAYSDATANAKWLVALSSNISNNVAIPSSAHEVEFKS
jgi:nuclear cap-binding protein subunit 1